MFEPVIVDQNPHWEGIPYTEGVRRETLDKVTAFLDLPHIVSIVGVRRAGKSTLARQAINYLMHERRVNPRNILFLNLETPQFSRFRNDIMALERIYEDYLKFTTPQGMIYCFLDEVHFFPEWHIFVKSCYERKNVKTGMAGATAFNFSENTGHFLENLIFLEQKRRGNDVFYYRTANSLEVDFAIRKENRLTELIQVTMDMKTKKTRTRERKDGFLSPLETDVGQCRRIGIRRQYCGPASRGCSQKCQKFTAHLEYIT